MVDEVIKKKPINGKQKGNGFEGDIAKLFTAKFAPLNFKRTQSSGAIVGGYNAWSTKHYSPEMLGAFVGDIFPCNESDVLKEYGWTFKRTVECKFYRDADSFTALFKNPQIAEWFEQAAEDAKKLPGKLPLLIFKFNRTPIFFAIDSTDSFPALMSGSLELSYNTILNKQLISRKILIGLLDDALKDLNWWKLYESEKS